MQDVTDLREQRRATRRWEIQQAACVLVMERGYDGFTMDDLAQTVGVSRRTLFNHVRDKAAAVLGEDVDRSEHERVLQQFTALPPAGDLEAEILDLVRQIIVAAEKDVPQAYRRHLLLEQALAADPKLAQLAFHRLQEDFRGVTDAACTRQQWVAGDLRARVAVARVGALLPVVFEEVRRRGGAGSFLQVFDDVRAAARPPQAAARGTAAG